MAMRLFNSLDMTPGQPEAHNRSDVTMQCLGNMLHRDAGDCLYPGGIVNVMPFTTSGSVTGSEQEVQCLLSFHSNSAMTQRCEKHSIVRNVKRS